MTAYEKKLDRVLKALSFREPDRVPRFDLFWQEFIDKWRLEKGLAPGANINEYYDHDFVLCVMNEDPKVDSFTLIERGSDYTVFKSGFGCTSRCGIRGLEFRWTAWRGCSSPSARRIRRRRGNTEAPVWAWRSANAWWS